MHTRSFPRSVGGPDYLHSQSSNRSENAFVNNITDPVHPRGQAKFVARLTKQHTARVMVRSNGDGSRVPVNLRHVTALGITTCVFAGTSEPPAFVLLSIPELASATSGVRDAGGSPEYDASFPLLLKQIGTNVYAADNQVSTYAIDMREPLQKLSSMTLTFRDGVTSEQLPANQWSISVVFEVHTQTPDDI